MEYCPIVVVGGGAAGFFAAIHAGQSGHPVVLLEKTQKLLAKVAISGGGRCNVTHACPHTSQLVRHYPRGGKQLKKAFDIFGTLHTVHWFESRGVALKTEADGRMFPVSDNSASIVNCLMKEAAKAGVEIRTGWAVQSLQKKPDGMYLLRSKSGAELLTQSLIIAAGGFSKETDYDLFESLNMKTISPVPSLFTFNIPQGGMNDLMGLSVPKAAVQIEGTKWREEGPVLITHWGLSGPAVIKLSAWAARDLHGRAYRFNVLVNWTATGEEEVRNALLTRREKHPRQLPASHSMFDLPARLWHRLLERAGIHQKPWSEQSNRELNLLTEQLVRSKFEVNGKTTFKEEFVTCGGIDLSEVNLKTFECHAHPGLFFAGEVLNVDGITGGFNFQHAWTSGFLAGTRAAQKMAELSPLTGDVK
ncbi:MAG: NAD(P)/FAD-dependent oxidoreductase [Cryomorphaceae bacterium]|nr:MAG: NAD(P)/FAD-dependent oxidoreductase [Cryomorphaceae bacterium]